MAKAMDPMKNIKDGDINVFVYIYIPYYMILSESINKTHIYILFKCSLIGMRNAACVHYYYVMIKQIDVLFQMV